MDLKKLFDQSNLKMAYKGVILVSVPLILGLIFILALFLLLVHTEEEAQREAHSRRVASLANNFSRGVIDSAYSISGYILTRSEPLGKRYDETVAKLPQQIQELADEVKDSREQSETVDHMRMFLDRALKLLNTLRHSSDEGTDPRSVMYILGVRAHLNALLKEFIAEEHKLVSAEAGAPDLMSSAKVRGNLKRILILGILLNIAMSLLLALYFSRTITGRLNVLVENTSRLLKKEKLLPTLQGNDEIAQLDAVFHQMATSLEEVQRLKQDFVNMISHDLKTPLTSIVGNLALVSADAFGPLSERGKHIVSTSEKQAARLVNLINDLLLLEKIEAGGFELHLTRSELSEIISDSIEAVSQAATDHSIVIEAPKTEAQIEVDAMRLEQVLINLLSNAIKFSPDHAVIKILVDETPQFLEVKVVDQGRGIPAVHRQDIFEKFKQIEPSDSREKGGTGLGLPICKLIIEKHDGTIGVESAEEKGSTFWFRIPRSPKSKFSS